VVTPPAEWTKTLPFEYDIATGFYPQDQPKAGFESHPCLILRLQQSPGDGAVLCLVVFGSSKLKAGRFNDKSDLIISDPAIIKRVGLFKPTRFYISQARQVRLPWDETGFECWDGYPSPILGSLTDVLIREVEYCLMDRERRLGRL
jgi:hypothetical protein